LLVADNDTSAAIVSSFATMSREDQAALLETLRSPPPWMWWLDLPAAEKVVAILPELDPASRDLIENRLLPPWLHRVRRQTERDDAIPAAAWLYAEERTGRVTERDCRAL
jgi:hypothetical protein